jgi:hypothetical protein
VVDGWGTDFVESVDAFFAEGLGEAVDGAAEHVGFGGLEADFDGVEWVTGWVG